MSIHIFSAKKLAKKIARGEVGAKDRAYYLAVSFLIFIVFMYSGLVSANPVGSWLSIYEAIVVAAISIIGVLKAYEAAGGDSNTSFVTEFTCLYVPVSVTTYLVIWSVYWAIVYGFRESIIAMSESHFQIALNLSKIGADFFGLMTFLAVALVQFITFFRITRLFYDIREQHSS